MSLRVYKRDILIKNTILYCIFSFLYLHVVYCLEKGISAFDLSVLKDLFYDEKYLVALGFVTIVNIFSLSKFSIFLMASYFSIIFVKSISLFFIDYDKILLGLNVLFIVVSYFYCLFIYVEFKEAVYNPGYRKNFVDERKSFYDFPVKLAYEDGVLINGYLTNWADNSCFIFVEDPEYKSKKGRVVVNLKFEDRHFVQLGRIVTGYPGGIGIKFEEKKFNEEGVYSWKEFYSILESRGYQNLYV